MDRERAHIWKIDLEVSDSVLPRLKENLTSDELIRADRYCFPEHRRRFIVTRAVLRLLLARELRTGPDQISIQYGPQGKPDLTTRCSKENLHFNVSHSHEQALIAIAYDRMIGVDVEKIRFDVDDQEISTRYFTLAEADALRSLPPSERVRTFFAYWTCKEAFIKARGSGLITPLDQFEVILSQDQESVPVQLLTSLSESEEWFIRRMFLAPEYAAAVAAAGPPCTIVCQEWDHHSF